MDETEVRMCVRGSLLIVKGLYRGEEVHNHAVGDLDEALSLAESIMRAFAMGPAKYQNPVEVRKICEHKKKHG